MSKIQEYRQKKSLADRLAKCASAAAGNGQCDKFGAKVTLSDTHIGYYGNSSCSGWHDDIVQAVKREIEGHWWQVFKWAAEAAARDAEVARRNAEAEAREVLGETAPTA